MFYNTNIYQYQSIIPIFVQFRVSKRIPLSNSLFNSKLMAGPLDFIKPFADMLPVITPVGKSQKVTFPEKQKYTLMVLGLFLAFSQVPLFGIQSRSGADPMYWVRAILASNRGTLMELGISPIVTASMILQLLVGAKILRIDQNVKEDRETYQAANKIFGILLTLAQAFVFVISGMYGNVGIIGGIFIIAQLLVAGVLVILLDEVMSAGYGLGSGTTLFITTNVCETIVWKAFSPMTVNNGGGAEFEGCIIALFHLLFTRNPFYAITHALFRSELPNIMNLVATGAIVVVATYLQGVRVELALSVQNMREVTTTYPIKLFYTSNVPIMLLTSFTSNVFFISQLLHARLGGNPIISLIGKWGEVGGQISPIGGLVYYLSPPHSLLAILYDPVHFVLYTLILVSACALFSRTWIGVAGNGPKDVLKQFKQEKRNIKGLTETSSQLTILNKYIPTAALLSGITVALLTIIADLLGAIGSGTGILLAIGTCTQYVEMLEKEQVEQFAE